jgi:serine O-acetyltransferase
MLRTLREDVACVLERDPAATHWLHVVLFWPGLHALWAYRLAHRLWKIGFRFGALWITYWTRAWTGIEIHPGAQIGRRLFIDHGMGVVIGETAEIGEDVTLYHGVTLGGVSSETGKRHPTLESGVVIGAGAKILGAITIGQNTRVGANAVVVKDVPSGQVVVGIPGKAVIRGMALHHRPDLHHDNLPDVIADQLDRLRARLETLEQHVDESHASEYTTEPDYSI